MWIPISLPTYSEYIKLESIRDNKGNLLLVVNVLTDDFPSDAWGSVLKEMRSFLTWIFETKTKYFLIFDCHRCKNIPMDKFNELRDLLEINKKILKRYLQATAIITNNLAVELLINTALSIIPPTKATKVFCSSGCCDSIMVHDIPKPIWDNVTKFIYQ